MATSPVSPHATIVRGRRLSRCGCAISGSFRWVDRSGSCLMFGSQARRSPDASVWSLRRLAVPGAGPRLVPVVVLSAGTVAGRVVRSECAGYRAFVTPLDQPSTHRPARATVDVVAALTLAVLGWVVVIGLPVLVWYWPVW